MQMYDLCGKFNTVKAYARQLEKGLKRSKLYEQVKRTTTKTINSKYFFIVFTRHQ